MLDKNNIKKVRGILSAKQGTEIPKFQTGAKFTKQKGSTIIYSSDYNTWFSDPNLTLQYFGDISQFQDISTKTIRNTNIPGANPTEGNPNAAMENNAQVLEQANRVNIQNQALQLSGQPLPKLDTIVSKNNTPELSFPKTIEVTPEQQASFDTAQKTGLMNIENQKQAIQQAKNIKAGQIAQIGTQAFTAIGDAFGAAQATNDSKLTQDITTGYKAVQNVASNFGPIGQAVSSIMGIASATGDILQSIGGGTDQQSTLDKWMDSPLLSWNVGAINGFLGKKSDSFGIDQDTVASVGSSYGGTVDNLNDASQKANKKYGLFSSKARKKANAAIADAKAKQNLMGDISDTASDQRLAVQSMGEQTGIAYSMMTSGGYDQKYTYAAKQGGILGWNPVIELEWEPQIELNWELPEFKEGGSVDLVETLEQIPELQKGGKTRTLEQLFEYAKKENPRFIQRLSESPRGITFIDDDGNESKGSHYLEWATDDRGAVVYPRIQEMDDGSLKFLSSKKAWERANKSNNILIMSPQEAEMFFAEDPEYHTAYKRGWPDFFKSYKKGGALVNGDIPETEETTQKNVIPEGALHKNKHHMEHAEGLTKKGIPVIDDNGEQQAEIEHSEIIFTLEVTKKLEEYYEIFYSENSSNKEKEQAALDAGKLLVYQILENTEDRTGLIDSCKKGGTLTLKKSTDDLIEEVLEWMPTLMVIEEVIEEVKEEEKPKKKSEKEQMKESIKEVLIELLTK